MQNVVPNNVHAEEVLTAKLESSLSSYEDGCNRGTAQACEFMRDDLGRFDECLKSALINCHTWADKYKEDLAKRASEPEKISRVKAKTATVKN
jgi:hypothetical protein